VSPIRSRADSSVDVALAGPPCKTLILSPSEWRDAGEEMGETKSVQKQCTNRLKQRLNWHVPADSARAVPFTEMVSISDKNRSCRFRENCNFVFEGTCEEPYFGAGMFIFTEHRPMMETIKYRITIKSVRLFRHHQGPHPYIPTDFLSFREAENVYFSR
jgi:hypothetical protein